MNLHGPQDDRDRHWNGRWDNHREDLARKEAEAFEGEVTRLRNENKSLKDQLQRSLKELRAYQIKYPSPYVPNAASEDEANMWSAAPEAVNPLLEAYDTRILELEDTIKQQNFKIENFKEKIQTLIGENEEFRNKQLDELKHNSSSASASTPYRLDPSLPLQQELLTELQQRIAVVMDENAILVEQKVVLSTELDRQQSLVSRQVKELHELHNTVGELTREVGILRNSIAQIEGERNEAAKHALQCSDMLGKNEQEIEVLQDQLHFTQAKLKEYENINADLDKKCRLMSQKYDEDGVNIVKKLHYIEERVKELTMLNHQKQSELDSTTDVLRKLRSEYHTTRKDAEGMLQVMNGMEKQLNEYAIREDMINKLQVEAREKLEEAITIKEECIVKEEQSQREIERLLNERKQYLLQRQSDIDKAVDIVKKSYSEQIQQLEKEMDDYAMRNGQLLFDNDRISREYKSLKDLYERLQQSFNEEQSHIQQQIHTFTEQLHEKIAGYEQEKIKRIEVQEQNSELRMIIDKYRAQMENTRLSLSSQEKVHEQEHSLLKHQIKDLQRDVSMKEKAYQKKSADYQSLQSSFELQRTTFEQKYLPEIQTLMKKLSMQEEAFQELTNASNAQEMRLSNVIETLKEKLNSQLLHWENKYKQELEKNKIAFTKIKNLEMLHEEAQEQKNQYQRFYEDSQTAIYRLQEEIQHLRQTITLLTQQLTLSHQEREDSVYRAAKAIEELNLRAVTSPMKLGGVGGIGGGAGYGGIGRGMDWDLQALHTATSPFIPGGGGNNPGTFSPMRRSFEFPAAGTGGGNSNNHHNEMFGQNSGKYSSTPTPYINMPTTTTLSAAGGSEAY